MHKLYSSFSFFSNINITLEKFLTLFLIYFFITLYYFEKDKNDFEKTIEHGKPFFLLFK